MRAPVLFPLEKELGFDFRLSKGFHNHYWQAFLEQTIKVCVRNTAWQSSGKKNFGPSTKDPAFVCLACSCGRREQNLHCLFFLLRVGQVRRKLERSNMSDLPTSNEVKVIAAPVVQPTLGEKLKKAGSRALQSGGAGAMAMAINVCTLMWMRTTINYQYANGGSTLVALKTLYKEGGIPRFYRGLAPALVQGPMSRFGDTAANAGALAVLDSFESTKDLSVAIKTGAASVTAALFRIFLAPVDTFKTTMQVHGKDGVASLMTKFRAKGPSVFYHGSLAAASATAVGHYPWFFVSNVLQEKLPKAEGTAGKLARNAFIGFTATCVSDTLSNSIRVVKTFKQASKEAITYPEAIRSVIAVDGVQGLFLRGLGTKLISNGVQGMMFSVLWKLIDEQMTAWKK
jgi:hypothetical protein